MEDLTFLVTSTSDAVHKGEYVVIDAFQKELESFKDVPLTPEQLKNLRFNFEPREAFEEVSQEEQDAYSKLLEIFDSVFPPASQGGKRKMKKRSTKRKSSKGGKGGKGRLSSRRNKH